MDKQREGYTEVPFEIPDSFLQKIKEMIVPGIDRKMMAIDEWLIEILQEHLTQHIIRDGNKETHKLMWGDKQIGDALEIEIVFEEKSVRISGMTFRRIPQ